MIPIPTHLLKPRDEPCLSRNVCRSPGQPDLQKVTFTRVLRLKKLVPAPVSNSQARISCEQTISAGSGFSRHRSLTGSCPEVCGLRTRAKDSLLAVRCHTRSPSKISQSQHPAAAGFFVAFPTVPAQ